MKAERLISYADALREGTEQAMAEDARVFMLGQGIDDCKAFQGTTRGLVERFGAARVFDTPLSEDGMTGVAIGAALAGMRPIHTHIRMDFMLLAMNQIANIAAKTHYMYDGAQHVPLVIRAVIGRSWGQGAQHSQGLHGLFMHFPGLRVVAPTTPYDAKGALIASVRDDNPVIFVEHRMLHGQMGHVPEEAYATPLGKARTLRAGSDVTIVAISHMVVESLRAAVHLAAIGIEAEVIDPVWLAPLDIDTIVASVARTGRLLVVDTAWTTCGASAEIMAQVTERLQDERPLKLKRLGYAPTPCPTTKNLEDAFYPNPERIASMAHGLVRGQAGTWLPTGPRAPEVVQFRGPF